jgi:DNA-binding MarR family transcriptional regulator
LASYVRPHYSCRRGGVKEPTSWRHTLCAVLSALVEHGPMPQRRVGQLIDLDKSSMVLLVDALERDKLVVQTWAAHHRRRRD